MENQNIKNREEFLQTMKSFLGQEASVRMHGSCNRLKCTVEAVEPNFDFIAVSNLQTPIGTKKSAVLRVDDLVELEFDLKKK